MIRPSPAQTAYDDQTTAAITHARTALVGAALAAGGQVRLTLPSPWLLEQILTCLTTITAGTARHCPHITGQPQVVHAAVWAPGLFTCAACAGQLTPGPTEDHTCDRCRRTVPAVIPATAAIGSLLLGYGLCPSCARTCEPTTTETTR